MYMFLSPLAFLPLIEIIGLFVIGGEIGFLWSVIWLVGATMLGFRLLRMSVLVPLPEEEDGFFAAREAFDSLCLMIAGLLLIFPGFVSDFFAVPFILSPFRHWLFGRAKDKDSFMRRFTKQSRGFRQWTYAHTRRNGESERRETVIEGEFRRVDDEDERLPKG